jgi:hypothetical protein
MVKKLHLTQLGKRLMKKEKPLTVNQLRFLNGVSEAVREINLHRQGKIKMQSLEEFLQELRDEGLLE